MIDREFGPYRVLEKLGEGGMGQVYRARDTRLTRDVALKVLPPAVAGNPDALARFRREAQVLATLNHPNIATLHGFEEVDGTSALVMELVPGQTLSDLIRAQRLSLSETLDIARQIALALEAAHEAGIVHRDLKPANVKVRDDGVVKVLDFGLAKALAPDSAGSNADAMHSPTITAHATQLGVILGTAAYMSPEQAKGRVVDRRADIWAFGVVLYEMLTGQRGYEAEDISETLAAVLTRDVDWAKLPADTPPRLTSLLRDCLVRDPRQRLRDIGEARRALDHVIAGTSGTVTSSSSAIAAPASSPARNRLPWSIAAVAIVVAALAVWRGWRPEEPPAGGVTRGRFTEAETASFVTISRDGTKIVYAAASGLRLRQVDQFESRAIDGAAAGVFAAISPDGAWLAFSGNGGPNDKIRKVAIAGGTPVVLADGTFQFGADWIDDDAIVYSGPQGLMRLPAGGGAAEVLTKVDPSKGEAAHRRPQVLPGGREILFTVASNTAPAQFAVLDVATRQYQTFAPGGGNGRYLPTGHLTYVRERVLYALPYDLQARAATGSEIPVVAGVSTLGPAGTGDYAFAPNGLLVYAEAAGQQGTTLVWADRKGVISAILGQVPRLWGTGRLSPDGRFVANAIGHDHGAAAASASAATDIWVMDLDRGAATRLTSGGGSDRPIWTADGRGIVYSHGRDGKFGLYAVPADGSAPPRLVIATAAVAYPTSLTADGKTLLYSTSGRVFVLSLGPDGTAAGEPRRLRDSSAPEGSAVASPDGARVAFVSSESGANEVYVMPLAGPGGRIRVSIDGGVRPRWSKDGRELFFWTGTAQSGFLMTTAVQLSPTFSVGKPVLLFKASTGTTWDPAPDGNRFLIEVLGTIDDGKASAETSFAIVTNWFDELRRLAPPKSR